MSKQSKTNKITSFQSHYLLADNIQSMIRALQHEPKNEIGDAAIKSLKEQRVEHQRKAQITGDLCIMIT